MHGYFLCFADGSFRAEVPTRPLTMDEEQLSLRQDAPFGGRRGGQARDDGFISHEIEMCISMIAAEL